MATSTYSAISTLVGEIYEIALMNATEQNIMAPLVTTWNDTQSSQPRMWATYSGGTFGATAETADLSSQALTPAAAGTATPAVYAQQIVLSNRRIKSDPMGARNEAGIYLGNGAAEHIDTNLAGLFSSFTGGTVGTAGGTLTWANVFRAQAYMRANKVPGSYVAVFRPEQWYYLNAATSGVPTLLQSNQGFMDSVLRPFYQGSYSGIDFLVDANITSGTAAVAGMFARPAVYLDIRQPFVIQPEYDASLAGNGAWELNASLEYAYGVFRPTYGVQMIGTSS